MTRVTMTTGKSARTPPRPTAKRPPVVQPVGAKTRVSDLVTSLLTSIVAARGAMDRATAELARVYSGDPILRTFPVPAFGIAEVKVRLRFAVSGLASRNTAGTDAPSPEMLIIVDLSSLEKTPEHLLSEIEIRLEPRPATAPEYAVELGSRPGRSAGSGRRTL